MLSFTGDNHPPVKNCSATLAAAAGFHSDRISSPLDNVAKANVLISNEPRYAHTIWLAFILIASRRFFLFIVHDNHLFEYVASNDSYAAHAFSSGGTTVFRVPDVVVIASFTAAAVTF